MVASRLRQLASDRNVHICVIIHPKKVDDDNNLTVGSIFGTAKISQEADSIMILQKNNIANYRILQVKKNRFDGEVGEVSMLFNPDNKRYFEITQEEKSKMLLSGGNYKGIIKDRINKYGAVEPTEVMQNIDMKVRVEDKGMAALRKQAKESKIKQLAKQDIEFYHKLRQHQSAEQGLVSPKDCHQFYTDNQEEEAIDNDKPIDVALDLESSFTLDSPLDDTSVTDPDQKEDKQ